MNIRKVGRNSSLEFYVAATSTSYYLPYFKGVSAGFPSPAEDHTELSIDLNKELIRNPSATFYVRVKGDSMKEAGIHNGDVLVVDRSLEVSNNAIAVCFLDGEFTIKRVKIKKGKCLLVPANKDYPIIEVKEQNEFQIWGLVTYNIKKM